MHFVVVVFSEYRRNLVEVFEPFGSDRFDYFDLNGPSYKWFVSKYGERTNSGFARELHFGAISNRVVAENISILPEYIRLAYHPRDVHAAVSSMLSLTPYAFVAPDGDWVGSDDVDAIAFHRYYNIMVNSAKRQNYHVTAVDCHI